MARPPFRFLAAAATALLASGAAWPLDFRSVTQASILYDSPSRHGKPLFVIARYTPVELVVAIEGWTKVRDSSGALAWIEKAALTDKRTVIVNGSQAEVRAKPDASAPVVFQCDKDVALDLLEAGPPGWAKVRHRDGASGYLRASAVWGL